MTSMHRFHFDAISISNLLLLRLKYLKLSVRVYHTSHRYDLIQARQKPASDSMRQDQRNFWTK